MLLVSLLPLLVFSASSSIAHSNVDGKQQEFSQEHLEELQRKWNTDVIMSDPRSSDFVRSLFLLR